MHGLRGDTSLKTHDIIVTNYNIKEQEKEYAEFCFDLPTRLVLSPRRYVRVL